MSTGKLQPFHGLDVVLVCGLPASGKSHFARHYFDRDGRKRVNRKEIRKSLYQMTEFDREWREEYFDSSDEGLVKHVERRVIEHLLHGGSRVLVDNTSVSAASRKSYITVARQMHRTIGVVFLHTPLQRCLQRNANRTYRVPDIVMTNLAAAIELPRPDERFDELLVIHEY